MKTFVLVALLALLVMSQAFAAGPPSWTRTADRAITMSAPFAAVTMTPTAATGDVGIIGSFALQAAQIAPVKCAATTAPMDLTALTPCDFKAAGTFCATAAPTKITAMGIGTGMMNNMIAERQIVRTGTTRTCLSWVPLSRTACPSRGTIPATVSVVANLDSGAVVRHS